MVSGSTKTGNPKHSRKGRRLWWSSLIQHQKKARMVEQGEAVISGHRVAGHGAEKFLLWKLMGEKS